MKDISIVWNVKLAVNSSRETKVYFLHFLLFFFFNCLKKLDTPPDSIDALYDELEYPDSAASAFSRINPTEAGWLARHTRKQIDLSRERMGDEIEQELKVRISVIF
jgi:hypothetical protein